MLLSICRRALDCCSIRPGETRPCLSLAGAIRLTFDLQRPHHHRCAYPPRCTTLSLAKHFIRQRRPPLSLPSSAEIIYIYCRCSEYAVAQQNSFEHGDQRNCSGILHPHETT